VQIQSLLEQVFGALPEGLLLIRSDKTLLHLNTAAERMAGLSLSQAEGRPLTELFPGSEDLHERLQTTLSTGRSFTLRENELINRSGEALVVEIHIQPIHDEGGDVIGGCLILRDLSAFKKMEEELRHADRLGIMGTIASGLAHEIKNPLGGIKGAAQMLTRSVKGAERKEYLEIIVKEADRVSRLLTELLGFSKPQPIRFSGINLNKLLDELIQLEQQAAADSRIRFVRHFDPSLPKVRGDENQLKQAFLNFIKNARESIPKKGSIEITTWLVTDYQLKTEKGRPSRMVGVEISDTGCGMDEEILANLFAPFYTTKRGGTGLGLAISHRIISEHHGFIQVESVPKKGSRFKIFLRAL
jgi:two-component system, NtrC family, nitrogen regulation sensor histidine kinase GlnL